MKLLSRTTIEPYIFVCAGALIPLYTIFWLFQNFSWFNVFILYLAAFLIGQHNSVFMHRCWSHRAWHPKRYFNLFGLLMCSLTLSGNSLSWVSIHREHHRFSDTERDPHSPFYKSRLRVQFLTYLSEIKIKYVVDLARDTDHVFFAKYYWYVNIIVWLSLYLIDPYLLGFWFSMLGIIILKPNLINTLSHYPDKPGPRNNIFLATLFLSGEPFHANHHDDPQNYTFSNHWYQFDPSEYLIKLAFLLRLGTPCWNRTNFHGSSGRRYDHIS